MGHDWKLHISWKDKSGSVVSSSLGLRSLVLLHINVRPWQIVLGPWRVLSAGTSSHAEISILVALIRTVKKWLEGEYWGWMCRNVLSGLK